MLWAMTPVLHYLDSISTQDATVSVHFNNKGKLAALKVLPQQSYTETFTKLGDSWTVTDELFRELEHFMCRLYAAQTDITEINEMRCQIFQKQEWQC